MISIIGSGRVGSAIGFLAAAKSLDDIQLVNRTKEKAIGQALDISNAVPIDSSIFVEATDYSEIGQSEIVVISASVATYTTSRVEILSAQANMIKDIAKNVKKFGNPDSIILVVSNPVDILTYVFQKETNWPRKKLIGIASSLDSSRFRYLLAKELNSNQSEFSDTWVLGEHGDSMVPVFSQAKWKNKPILDILSNEQVQELTKNLKGYWRILRAFKGPSVYGISKNTFDVITSILKNKEIVVPGSVLLDGEYGLNDVCLGVPLVVDNNGVKKIKKIELNSSEHTALQKSSDVIKEYIKLCKITAQN